MVELLASLVGESQEAPVHQGLGQREVIQLRQTLSGCPFPSEIAGVLELDVGPPALLLGAFETRGLQQPVNRDPGTASEVGDPAFVPPFSIELPPADLIQCLAILTQFEAAKGTLKQGRLAERLGDSALIRARPGASAVSNPFGPTAAIVGLSERQSTGRPVRGLPWGLTSLAVTCTVSPTATLAGRSTMATIATGGGATTTDSRASASPLRATIVIFPVFAATTSP